MATRKTKNLNGSKKAQNLKWLCRALLDERVRLRGEIRKLSEENEMLKKSLGLVLSEEDIPINKEELLAQFGKEQNMAELIEELSRECD